MKLKLLKSLMNNENKKNFYFLIFLNFLNFIMEVGAISCLAIFGSLLINKNYINEKFNINLESFINEFDPILFFGIAVIFLYLLKNLFYLLLIKKQFNFIKKIKLRLSQTIFKSHIQGPFKLHLRQSPSTLTRDLTEAIKFTSIYILSLIDLFRETVAVISIYILLTFVNLKIVTISTFFLIIITSGFFLLLKKNLKKRAEKNFILFDKYLKNISNSFSAIKEIKIFKKHEDVIRNYSKSIKEYETNLNIFQVIERLPKPFLEIFSIVFLTLFCFIFYNDTINDNIVITLSIFVLALIRLIPAFSAITSNLNFLKIYEPGLKRIQLELNLNKLDHINQTAHLVERKNFKSNLDIKKNLILVDNLYFSYHPQKKNLSGVNMNIAEGEYICIIGETGSGKSTLLNIVLGLLSPDKGGVYYKNNNINLDIGSWHRDISLVSQDPYLLEESIAKNISFELQNEKIDYKKLEKAIEIAELKNLINSLENGIHTKVHAMSNNFSGGEKQRIAIARAVYRDTPIMFLDEFTNALDIETENKILNNLRNQKNKTLIMISHKQNTIKNSDKIWKLENGRINKLP